MVHNNAQVAALPLPSLYYGVVFSSRSKYSFLLAFLFALEQINGRLILRRSVTVEETLCYFVFRFLPL